MKTLDEIMKALSLCYARDLDDVDDDVDVCAGCAYYPDAVGESCIGDLHMDAAFMLNTLEDQNRALSTEVKVNRKSDTKTDDQQAKADAGKPRLTLVPPRIIWDIAVIREFGCKKYQDPENWRKVSAQRYRDAMFLHMMAYLASPHGKDPESGLPHLWHLACNVAFLCELEDSKD